MTRSFWLALALSSGCVIGSDRFQKPNQLPDSWQVDRLRILGIAAEPPEVAPGGVVSFDALVADPNDEVALVVWLLCADADAGDFGCSIDLEGLDPETTTPDDLAARGVIGIQPFFPPVWAAPSNLLDGLDEASRRNGIQVTVQVAALTQDAIDSGDDFDFNEIEVGYKRLIVSDEPQPNQNPTIEAFSVDGVAVGPDDEVAVTEGALHEVGLELGPDAAEAYSWINSSGEAEDRVEEPYARWYASGGSQEEDTTLVPYLDADWIAPSAGTTGTWWVVLRDRRGGMSWTARTWRAVAP